MDRFRVAVLGVLDKKHHEERYNGRPRVDDKLPGIGVMKSWSGNGPSDYDQDGSGKGPGASEYNGLFSCKDAKNIGHRGKEISRCFLSLQLLLLSLH